MDETAMGIEYRNMDHHAQWKMPEVKLCEIEWTQATPM